MTLRDAIGELRWLIIWLLASAAGLVAVAILAFDSPIQSGGPCVVFKSGCAPRDAAYGALPLMVTLFGAIAGGTLAGLSMQDSISPELRRVAAVLFGCAVALFAGLAAVTVLTV